MADNDFWSDPIFARAGPLSNVVAQTVEPQSTIKQSVPKLEIPEAERRLLGDNADLTIRGWDGFWADPVFKDVAGRNDLPEGQTRDFFKYEVDESVSLASLFPSLSDSAFGEVAFRKSAVEFWAKPIGNEPAGLRLRTEVEFSGILDDVFSVFKVLLAEAKPFLRLSAHLGLGMQPEQSSIADGLTLSGSLLGLAVQFPPGIPIIKVLSIGVQVTIGRSLREETATGDAGPSSLVQYHVFGSLNLDVPGSLLALTLDYRAELSDDITKFIMTVQGKETWDDALGVPGFHLTGIEFKASFPLEQRPTTEQIALAATGHVIADAPEVSVTASWDRPAVKAIKLEGKICKGNKESYLKASMEDVTWNDICSIFSEIYGSPVKSTEHEITCDKLKVEISSGRFCFQGSMSIDKRPIAKASIILSTSGITISADVQEWEIEKDYVVIKNAHVELLVGKGSSSSTESTGPAAPKGDDTKSHLGFLAAAKDRGKSKAEFSDGSKDVSSSGPTAAATTVTAAPKDSGWQGGLEVTGDIVINKDISIRAALAVKRDRHGKWFWVVCGRMKGDLSLRDFVKSVEAGSEFDLRLKQVTVLASSVDDPLVSHNTYGYKIKQGLYVCAMLEKVPLLDGKTIKKPVPEDTCYLSLGYPRGGGFPSVAVFLPQSMKVDLGPRFTTERFSLLISPSGSAGIECSFVGTVLVRLEETREPLRFELVLRGNAIGGKASLVMNGSIENPLGLSKELTIGPKLGIGFDVIWAQLASTGLPSGLDIMASFYLRQSKHDPYSMVLKLNENPKDMLIKIDTPKLSYSQIIEFIALTMEQPIDTDDRAFLEFRDVHIYASMSCTFGSETYPAGFRFQGIVIICDHEAGMDCSLTTAGLHLKAWVPSFKLGPLKVNGPVVLPNKEGTFALLELDITLEKQAFVLIGSLEIFSLKAAVDIHCQFMPKPVFYFDFKLTWSTLVSLELHAEMIDSGYIHSPGSANWKVSATFQQTIISEITKSMQEALKSAHEAAQAGIKTLKDGLAEEEKKYKESLQKAMDDLKEKSAAYDLENDQLQAEIDLLEAETTSGNVLRRGIIGKAETKKVLSDAEATNKADMDKAKAKVPEREKEKHYIQTSQESEQKKNVATGTRDERKLDFYSRFGNANTTFHNALASLSREQGFVNDLEWKRDALNDQFERLSFFNQALALNLPIQVAELTAQIWTARISLGIAEAAVKLGRSVIESDLFQDMRKAWQAAENAIATMGQMLSNAVDLARQQWENAQGLTKAVIAVIDGDYVKALAITKKVVDDAKEDYDDFAKQQAVAGKKLQLQLDILGNSTKKTLVTAAEGAVRVAKDNDVAFKAAKLALDGVDKVESAVYESLNDFVTAAVGELCNIQDIRLVGEILADEKDQKPFHISVKGTIVGKRFDFTLEWTPGKNVEFLSALAKRAINHVAGK